MKASACILITPGEPAGIGPDVTVQIAQSNWPVKLIALADPELLYQRANLLGLPLDIKEITPDDKTEINNHKAGELFVIPIKTIAPVEAQILNVANAEYVLRTLELATHLCINNEAQAIVTGPVQKSIMQKAGIAFNGHTEFFAEQCGVAQTVMLFALEEMKVALATTHLPLAQVPAAITEAHLRNVLMILHRDLQQKFHIQNPRIAVCGLNPHAGEDGHIGREEIEIISPLIHALQQENLQISGPYPADTIFIQERLNEVDAILAMYHDQALPLVKYIGFDRAVNVTLGLPFVRTSVDHGTALGIAGTNASDSGSMRAALQLAIDLTR